MSYALGFASCFKCLTLVYNITFCSEQIIRGTDLSLTTDLSGLRGFGTSLASGVDVDMNSYNGTYSQTIIIRVYEPTLLCTLDLLIGSFLSQKVFLLRY